MKKETLTGMMFITWRITLNTTFLIMVKKMQKVGEFLG